MKHDAKLTISRPSYSGGDKKILITVEDKDAVTGFLTIEISYENFASCLTGMGMSPCVMEVRNLECVGLKRETKKLKFKVEGDNRFFTKREANATASAVKATPAGWEPNLYFGSRDSFYSKGDELWATVPMYRWVKKEEEDG